ncbi:MAG: hypothetical protein QG637_1508, partial [Chloroflexota bacterium]|nr:hypothetical protein [Chloroflexota bacterium]
ETSYRVCLDTLAEINAYIATT